MVSTNTSELNKVIVLLGPPSSGKGTITALASKRFGFPVVPPGEIYRRLRVEDSAVGALVRESLKDGGYCPSWLTNQIMAEETARVAQGRVVIHDGYPRTQEQLEFLQSNFQVMGYLYLTAPFADLQEANDARRSCQGCGLVFSVQTGPMPQRLSERCLEMCSGLDTFDDRRIRCARYGEQAWERRWDGDPDFYQKRYQTYMAETQPIVEAVKNSPKFSQFTVLKQSPQVTEDVLNWIQLMAGGQDSEV